MSVLAVQGKVSIIDKTRGDEGVLYNRSPGEKRETTN